MDSTVTAAAIGVGGTVVVGVAGFGAAIWNTRRTIANDREKRVWDKRAEVYVAVLAAVQYRQLQTGTWRDLGDPSIELSLVASAESEPPDWHKLEALMRAFASEAVLMAMEASSAANEDFVHRLGQLGPPELAGPGGRRQPVPLTSEGDSPVPGTSPAAARPDPWQQVQAADDALVELIRAELQGRDRPRAPGPRRHMRDRLPSIFGGRRPTR